jgi:hypothetical protein
MTIFFEHVLPPKPAPYRGISGAAFSRLATAAAPKALSRGPFCASTSGASAGSARDHAGQPHCEQVPGKRVTSTGPHVRSRNTMRAFANCPR